MPRASIDDPKLPAQYSAAKRALAVAVKVEQAKHVHDVASTMAVYAYKAKDPDMAGDAAEIVARATRVIGEINDAEKRAGKQAKGTRGRIIGPGRGKKTVGPSATRRFDEESLFKRGVDKHLADRARRLFGMTEPAFEREVARVRRLAAAAAQGDREIVQAAKAERHAKARARRAERETAVAGKIAALPDKRYGVIYADPEWKFETYNDDSGKLEASADLHYTTSSLDEIKARDVPSISASDCVLFLWATVPMLPHALEVMGAWGFDYVSHLIWKKDKGGTGYWFRNWHELLLVGTRGSIPAPAQGSQWASVIEAPRGRHSEKPDRFYELIEEYYPNIPKIELNQRKARPGWDGWGFEAPLSEAAA
jgi:N6-adenosine-specific RNA methylase IME4